MTSVAHTRVCNAFEGWAGRIPQTQIALRNAVTVNLGPVSGLTSDFHHCDAFPHQVQWLFAADGPVVADRFAYRCGGSAGL